MLPRGIFEYRYQEGDVFLQAWSVHQIQKRWSLCCPLGVVRVAIRAMHLIQGLAQCLCRTQVQQKAGTNLERVVRTCPNGLL